jgi:hypothetical protein
MADDEGERSLSLSRGRAGRHGGLLSFYSLVNPKMPTSAKSTTTSGIAAAVVTVAPSGVATSYAEMHKSSLAEKVEM